MDNLGHEMTTNTSQILTLLLKSLRDTNSFSFGCSSRWETYCQDAAREEIGVRLGVDPRTVRDDIGKNSKLGKISDDLGPGWNDRGLAEWAERKCGR